jgi:hypothetical protein
MDLVSIENLRYSELYKNIKSVKIVHMMILTSAQLVTHPSFHLFHKPDPAHASKIFDRGERQRRVLYIISRISHLIRAWDLSCGDGDVQKHFAASTQFDSCIIMGSILNELGWL